VVPQVPPQVPLPVPPALVVYQLAQVLHYHQLPYYRLRLLMFQEQLPLEQGPPPQ
jgi:hypothetical protein